MSLSCEKATVLIEKQTITRLSLGERIKLRMHLNKCQDCKNFKIDSEKMDQMIKHQTPSTAQKLELSAKIKQQIIDNSKGE